MSCQTYDVELGDYVDGVRARPGERADVRHAAFEQHLLTCSRCQALVADFGAIRQAAAGLPDHSPPARLRSVTAAATANAQRMAPNRRWQATAPAIWMPIAASLIILVGAASWFVSRQGAPVDVQADAGTVEGASMTAERHYEETIAGLQQIADVQHETLDPATLAVLQRNLAVIDRAINESRAALANEPASALAQESLLDALDVKVALLQDTVALANEVE